MSKGDMTKFTSSEFKKFQEDIVMLFTDVKNFPF